MDTNVLKGEFKLFEKVTTNKIDELSQLFELLESHGFKRGERTKVRTNYTATAIDNEYSRKDMLLAYTGNTNSGNLISVWSRSGHKENAKKTNDFGVRISEDLLKKLISMNKAIGILTATAKYEDSNENRMSFTSVNGLIDFFETFFYYVDVVKQTKSADNVNEEKAV